MNGDNRIVVSSSLSNDDMVTIRNDSGSHYTSVRFVNTMKVYRIRQEVTAGKNRPDQNVYIEDSTSPSRQIISRSTISKLSKMAIRTSASSLMIITGMGSIHHYST